LSDTTPTNTGQFVVALSIEAFGDLKTFRDTADQIFSSFRNSTPFPGHSPVRIPGQDRGNVCQERRDNGIPLHPNLVKTLADIAAELNISELKNA
jgi:LDH2 family malate/lactate/ureidoglycolate dehydrogenase